MKHLIFILTFFYSVVSYAELTDGTYEQLPMASVHNMANSELKAKYFEKFNKNKITLKIKSKELTVSMFNGQDSFVLPITQYDKTIVANDGNMYWVLYQENKDTLHSTGAIFKRVANVLP